MGFRECFLHQRATGEETQQNLNLAILYKVIKVFVFFKISTISRVFPVSLCLKLEKDN